MSFLTLTRERGEPEAPDREVAQPQRTGLAAVVCHPPSLPLACKLEVTAALIDGTEGGLSRHTHAAWPDTTLNTGNWTDTRLNSASGASFSTGMCAAARGARLR